MNTAIRSLFLPFIAVAAGGHLCAQTFTNLGAVAPSPGTNDIYQLSTIEDLDWSPRFDKSASRVDIVLEVTPAPTGSSRTSCPWGNSPDQSF